MNSWETDDSHRPWPLPRRPWTMRHCWHDLTFLHWPVPVKALRPLIPESLQIDTYDHQAWIGVIPFWMTFRLRNVPWMPLVTSFAEINVRTYVRSNDVPGVWFLSLDCSSCLVASVARAWYGLRYFKARTAVERDGSMIHYSSRRLGANGLAQFEADCRPDVRRFQSEPGSLVHWLTERYCLFATSRSGEMLRGEIHHAPWDLQDAKVDVFVNSMVASHDIPLPPTPPIMHFAKRTEVLVWSPEAVFPGDSTNDATFENRRKREAR